MPRTSLVVLDERAEADLGLGQRLAAARERAGLTQRAAARGVRLPQSAIAKLERGKRQLHFLEGLRLAALYGVDCRDLDPEVGGDDPGFAQAISEVQFPVNRSRTTD